MNEVGVTAEIADEVLNLAKLASKYGLDGVVASPLESTAIRRVIPNHNFVIVTPGIRPIAATKGDQKRVTTPAEAIEVGADYLVVGRPVTRAADRRGAAEAILREIAAAQN
jgi:orotidine-5'-phosphate decarboxylase